MGDNTMRALASDLAYLEAWCVLATGTPLPWPVPESLLLKVVAHHLWDPVGAGNQSRPRHARGRRLSGARTQSQRSACHAR
ncbi:hypothetical protein AGR4C_pb30099 [Agrobacterium tumefaciens str. Kerr 14]|uniref:Uncharacterized protein n=1 Tax=Agrobacterium tumefaciens str. Kerr 14 TaxID=1183424 RepID=A0A1S7SF07_AGRTU|nr:hypothetical protein AGR4C_pb30099 [Agrobacterium tumefaciens str. Kerr 14]